MTSRQRSYLMKLASNLEPTAQIGKSGLTPETTQSVDEELEARELIKIHILKNCAGDGKDLAERLAQRTHSQVVQVIGRKIVLYRPSKKNRIPLPQRGRDNQ